MEDDDSDHFTVSGTITLDGASLDDDYTWYNTSNSGSIYGGWTSASGMTISTGTSAVTTWPTTTGTIWTNNAPANISIGNVNLEEDNDSLVIRKGDKEEDLFQMADRLNSLEELLGIPKRDFKLEKEYPDLTEIYNKQVDKVKEILGSLPTPAEYNKKRKQYEAWEKLKEKKDGNEE